MNSRLAVAHEVERMLCAIEKLHSNEGHGIVRQPVFLRTIKSARENIFQMCHAKSVSMQKFAADAAEPIVEFDMFFTDKDWRDSTPEDWQKLHQLLQFSKVLSPRYKDVPRTLESTDPINRITRYYNGGG